MDSTTSKTLKAPKTMNFDSFYLDLQKSRIFSNMTGISITFNVKNIIFRLMKICWVRMKNTFIFHCNLIASYIFKILENFDQEDSSQLLTLSLQDFA